MDKAFIAVLIKFETLGFTPLTPLNKGGNGLIVPLVKGDSGGIRLSSN